ncbi:MAG TPA: hypothetical protein VJH05_01630 [Candidatus Paceibacterota bacterium]
MKYVSTIFVVFFLLSSTTSAQWLFGEQGPTFYQNGVPSTSVVVVDKLKNLLNRLLALQVELLNLLKKRVGLLDR